MLIPSQKPSQKGKKLLHFTNVGGLVYIKVTLMNIK